MKTFAVKPYLLSAFTGLFLSVGASAAPPFVNGDFSQGLNGWSTVGDVVHSTQPGVVGGTNHAVLRYSVGSVVSEADLEKALGLPVDCLEDFDVASGSAIWQDVAFSALEDLDFSYHFLSNVAQVNDLTNQVFLSLSNYVPGGNADDAFVLPLWLPFDNPVTLSSLLDGYGFSYNDLGLFEERSIGVSGVADVYRVGFLITDGIPGSGSDSALAVRLAIPSSVPELDASNSAVPLTLVLILFAVSEKRLRAAV